MQFHVSYRHPLFIFGRFPFSLFIDIFPFCVMAERLPLFISLERKSVEAEVKGPRIHWRSCDHFSAGKKRLSRWLFEFIWGWEAVGFIHFVMLFLYCLFCYVLFTFVVILSLLKQKYL